MGLEWSDIDFKDRAVKYLNIKDLRKTEWLKMPELN
jgi:hypothetical protein